MSTTDITALLNRLTCPGRAVTARPWQIGIGSDLYAMATDGKMALVVADVIGFEFVAQNVADMIESMLLSLWSCRLVDLAKLQAWAKPPTWKNVRDEFDIAGGSPRVAKLRPGRLFGIAINRERLARLIDSFAEDRIRVAVSGATDPVLLYGSGWYAVLMPLHWGTSPLPAFDEVVA